MVHDESRETYQTICLGIKGLQLPDLPPNHIIAHNKTPIFHRPAQFDDLSALLQIILRQADQQAPLYLHICQQLMLSVLKLTEQMILEYGTENNIQQNELCAQVEAYIYTHYQQDLTIEQLGKLFFVSPYHLAHVFKQHTGYTLRQYILRRRIGEAQDRLSYSSDALPRLPVKSALKLRLIFPVFSPNTLACHPNFTANTARSPTSEQESLTKNGHLLWHAPDPARLSNLARAFRPALCNAQKSIAFAGTLYYNRLVA